jgi:hypothetical protein
MDRDVEVYAPNWPAGANVQAHELQRVLRGYLFGFLNTEEALKDFKSEGFFT